MRGRVMALWFVAFQGSTPIGGPIVGWVMAQAGARAGLGLGALTCLLVALAGLLTLQRLMPDSPLRERCAHWQPAVSRAETLLAGVGVHGEETREQAR